jgi:hypothetical protein
MISANTVRVSEARPEPLADSLVASGVLLETLVCDLHWSMLHVGALGQLAGACLRAQGAWTLRPWRHLLNDNSSAALLTLRYAPELGLSSALTKGLVGLQNSLSRLRAETLPWTCSNRRAGGHADLARIAEGWRHLARQGVDLLQALDRESAQLNEIYREDARTLALFLRETASGDIRRVDASGEINLPFLKQRRRTVRRPVGLSSRMRIEGQVHIARVLDLSTSGVGVSCRALLDIGARAELAIGDRHFAATIVRADQPNYGLRLTQNLRPDDPLFAMLSER